MSMLNSVEIEKLWFVSKKYHNLALIEKKYLSDQDMKYTIKDANNLIKDISDLEKHRHLIYFSAHLTSCAIRLFSIDEDKESERFRSYKDRKNRSEFGEIRDKLNEYIHFILRHHTAHAEKKRNDYPGQEIPLNGIYEILLTLTIKEIYESMEMLINTMKTELIKTIT